jgi:serine/threonine protein kinase
MIIIKCKIGLRLIKYYYLIIFYILFFKRKCVKKFIQQIPQAIRPSDLIQALQKCEAEKLSEFEHENIVKYYGFFIENNHVCIVLEYCDVNNIFFKII